MTRNAINMAQTTLENMAMIVAVYPPILKGSGIVRISS